MLTELKKTRDKHDLHNELGLPSADVTCSTRKVMDLKVTGTFQVCKSCILGKAKETGESKLAVVHSKNKGLYLFLILVSHLRQVLVA